VTEERDLLVSDAERGAAASDLRGHYEAGRLTLEEFEGRIERVHGARTESDLREALRQLPVGKLPSLSPRDARWRSLATQYALINVIALLVWLSSGAHGDFWPRWVMIVTLIMFVRRVFGRRGRRRQALPPPEALPPHRLP
jgi:hypothetical protein